jgi:N-acetylglucosamine-6-phosphate deacetylase
MRLRGRHYRTGERIDVTCADGVVTDVEPAAGESADVEAGWIAPGFFDLQVNGCLGVSFNSERLTTCDVSLVVNEVARHGVTGFLATLVTDSHDAWRHSLTTIARAIESDEFVAGRIAGVHLEGPAVSADDGPRGAHPTEHVRPPDFDEFQRLQEASGGRVRVVTLAPEHDGALPFIERVAALGVVVAIGHTAATPARIRDSVRAGARLSTHLGNGCHALLPRHDNPLWEQLTEDRLWASVIADGHHLPPAVVKTILRAKPVGRTVLVSDASSLAGLPPGRYREWGTELEVTAEGRVVVPGTPYLAGSAVFLDACVAHVAGGFAPLADAIAMASVWPRQLLDLPVPDLSARSPADFVLFDYDGGTVVPRATVTGAGISRCKGC